MSNTIFTKAERLGLLKSGLRPYINAELHIPNYYIETPHRIEPSLNLIYLPNSCNEYNLSYAKTAIEDVLSELEGVRLRYDDFNCKWFLEFGEMSMYDICETEEEKQTCVNKRIAINDAVMEARQRFPHNITNNAGIYMVYNNMYEIELTDNWEHIIFRRQSNYTKIEVCLYYVCYKSIDRNGCAVAINLKKGAYCALHPIFDAIEALVHSDGFSMWMERISYLALVEGTQQHVYTDAEHIKKYLFDPNISKELCNILGDFAKLW